MNINPLRNPVRFFIMNNIQSESEREYIYVGVGTVKDYKVKLMDT